ncbi:hypothetical protein [Actinacidiphila reveromycinica]|uniref:hypothetical protein n=1 Tax=Actinacidiphila reveromycinica TaxID=659352 RepID=UPI001921D68F|nr:hypothetical protein [Streptomyces sp. SN-593]
MGLTLGAGPVRTRALVAIGIPLLVVVVLGLWAGPSSSGSASGGSRSVPTSGLFGAPGAAPDDRQPTAAPTDTGSSDPFGDLFTTPSGTPTDPDGYGADDGTAPDGYGDGTGTDDGTGDGTADAGISGASPSATPVPAAVVTGFYDDVDDGDYADAWDLGGKNLDEGYDDFVAGFSDTASVDVTVTSVTGGTVFVSVESVHTDGTHHTYSGAYQVADGVITGGHLVEDDR